MADGRKFRKSKMQGGPKLLRCIPNLITIQNIAPLMTWASSIQQAFRQWRSTHRSPPATISTGMAEGGEFRTNGMQGGQELLPCIPNHITIQNIGPKMTWETLNVMQMVSREWRSAVPKMTWEALNVMQMDSSFENKKEQSQRKQLLKNGLEVAFDHGDSGDSTISDIPFQVLSWKPRALLYRRFASKLQCERIISLAKPQLSPSLLAPRKGQTEESTKDVRTRILAFCAINLGKSSTLTMTSSIQQYMDRKKIASMLVYISDVEEGGETMFPFENYQNMNIGYDNKQCIGLKVKPRQGDALLFYSVHPNGTLDLAAKHGSCPVISGEKWVATKWIRDIAS